MYDLLYYRVFDLVSVSFEFRFCACVLSWVEILVVLQVSSLQASYYSGMYVCKSVEKQEPGVFVLERTAKNETNHAPQHRELAWTEIPHTATQLLPPLRRRRRTAADGGGFPRAGLLSLIGLPINLLPAST